MAYVTPWIKATFTSSKKNKNENTQTTNKTTQTSTSNKTNTSTGSNKNSSSSSNNVYSGMSSSQLANERTYLNNLISQGGGNAEWAKGQLNQLNEVSKPVFASTNTSNNTNMPNSFYDYYLQNKTGNTEYVPSILKGIPQSDIKQGNTMANTITNTLKQYGVTVPEQLPPEQIVEEEENPYEDMKDYYKEDYFNYIKEQQRLANEAAVKSGVERLENQLKTTGQNFDEAGRNAYIQATQAEYALPNQLAAMGYTGGLSETEAARNRANYQNTMANLEQNRVNAQNEIYAAINNLRNTADQRTAEQNIELAREYADKLAQLELQGDLYRQQQADKELEDFEKYGVYQHYDDLAAYIQQLQATNVNGQNDRRIAVANKVRQQKLADQWKREREETSDEREAEQLEYQKTQAEIENAIKLGDFDKLESLGSATDEYKKLWNAELQKTIKSAQSSSGNNKQSKYSTRANAMGKAINSQYGDILIDYGNGVFKLNPDIPKTEYINGIVGLTIDNPNLSDDEKIQFLTDVGLDSEEIMAGKNAHDNRNNSEGGILSNIFSFLGK